MIADIGKVIGGEHYLALMLVVLFSVILMSRNILSLTCATRQSCNFTSHAGITSITVQCSPFNVQRSMFISRCSAIFSHFVPGCP